MARMGMDVDQVEAAGRSLKSAAGEIDSTIGRIDGIVKKLLGTWDGQDAQQFVNEWWPEHKGTLVAVKSSVDGLGQSALNNASEQRDVSGTYGGGMGVAPGTPGVNPAPVISAPGGPPPAFGGWVEGAVGRPIDVDKAYGNQCVDVINDYANTIYPGVPHGTSLGGGNAMDIYGNANPQYFDRIPSSGAPQPGDIICIGPNQYSSVGHVAVVESVNANGTVNVIQQNGANPSGSTYRGGISTIEMGALQGYLRPRG